MVSYMGLLILGFFLFLIIFGAWCADECPHKFKKISFREELDEYRNMRYSVRKYRCIHCQKCEEVDTRYGDPYE